MILTGAEIEKQVCKGRISITPFRKEFVNPNSYDFTLGATILSYRRRVLDVKGPNPTRLIVMRDSGYLLSPNRIYLTHTHETFFTAHYVPIFYAKSSVDSAFSFTRPQT